MRPTDVEKIGLASGSGSILGFALGSFAADQEVASDKFSPRDGQLQVPR